MRYLLSIQVSTVYLATKAQTQSNKEPAHMILTKCICFGVWSEVGSVRPPHNWAHFARVADMTQETRGLVCLSTTSDQQQVVRIMGHGCHNRPRLITRCDIRCHPHGVTWSPGGGDTQPRIQEGQDAKVFKVHRSFSTIKFLAQIQSPLGTYH